jgi:uncharacterized OsmC-like protein
MADTFELHLERVEGYRFRVDFGGDTIPPLVVDEPPPLGTGQGPNPARLLAAAVGNCLSASLVFCLSKARVEVAGVRTDVVGTYRRNERGRLRIGRLDVELELDLAGAAPDGLETCLATFEDYCVVTASVRQGLDVAVTVRDTAGARLFASPAPEQR